MGETGRSVGERTREHWADYKEGNEGSHIWDHMKTEHEGEEADMKLEIVKKCRSALERQVSETLKFCELKK